jgi:hypothetical protein
MNLEELLGALALQAELLERKLTQDWHDEDPA